MPSAEKVTMSLVVGMTPEEAYERVSKLHENEEGAEVGFFRINEWEVWKGIFKKIGEDRDAVALLYYTLRYTASRLPPR